MDLRYGDAVRRLVEAFPALTPELQKAARYIIENPEEIGLCSMRTVAGKAGVKPATVSRLSKALGFAEYRQLREPFRQRLRNNVPEFAARLQAIRRRGTPDVTEFFNELREQELENVRLTLSDANCAILSEAADTLRGSRRVYVLGLRGAFAPAFLFHYAYQLFRDNSQLLDTPAGIFADQLRGIGHRDSMLVVSFRPYTQWTIDATEYAAGAGANIVAVTDSMVSPVATSARHAVITQNRSASFYHSFTGALTVVQALIALLVDRAGGDALTIIEEAEKQLSRVSAYW